MFKKKTPPSKGLSEGPRMVACQWNGSSPENLIRLLQYRIHIKRVKVKVNTLAKKVIAHTLYNCINSIIGKIQ